VSGQARSILAYGNAYDRKHVGAGHRKAGVQVQRHDQTLQLSRRAGHYLVAKSTYVYSTPARYRYCVPIRGHENVR